MRSPDLNGVLLLIVFTGIRIISAINRGLYVFGEYQRSVEEELGEIGFELQWVYYIRHNQRDSGSYAFVVAGRAMNIAVTAYVIFDTVFKLSQTLSIALVLVATSTAIFVWNDIHIRKHLDPKGFKDRISKEFSKAREQAIVYQRNQTTIID